MSDIHKQGLPRSNGYNDPTNRWVVVTSSKKITAGTKFGVFGYYSSWLTAWDVAKFLRDRYKLKRTQALIEPYYKDDSGEEIRQITNRKTKK